MPRDEQIIERVVDYLSNIFFSIHWGDFCLANLAGYILEDVFEEIKMVKNLMEMVIFVQSNTCLEINK